MYVDGMIVFSFLYYSQEPEDYLVGMVNGTGLGYFLAFLPFLLGYDCVLDFPDL